MNTKNIVFVIFLMASSAFAFSPFFQSYLPTSLKIKVVDSNDDVVKNAKVTLYGNEVDYTNKVNSLFEHKITSEDGEVVFKRLKPMVYFIHASMGNVSNMAEEVLTDTLLEGRINKVTILITDD